ncbi:5-oxoprolinase subunit PxpB [Oceanisphaera arctica]|uniref:Allophanate hydrolase n=1 Tax=Oceanisphaera arctica TaxID=641510 RepID=A0A2P5TQN8_9GAMM|nr:5-oxoprolinase subunit PxpB [Oceanisphaera arctica]PPL18092.1 allophanate hydrolase [Oceanisphaera arctica]GHA09763.1 allophanate hydrolase [Oceanisphaera arctica]
MRITPVNENTVMVYFADRTSPETADNIAAICPLLRAELGQYLIDIIPSYTSILVTFDLIAIGLRDFSRMLKRVLAHAEQMQHQAGLSPMIELPVYYGPEVSLDAEEISRHTGLDFKQIIEIHASTVYRVYAIGFAPGFAYLGNTDSRIQIPRKQTPRAKVPKGSLALADQQTAIYPKSSPGGWQIIGRTPVDLIDFERDNLTMFEMGARVKFNPISREEFLALGGVIETDEYARVSDAAATMPVREVA